MFLLRPLLTSLSAVTVPTKHLAILNLRSSTVTPRRNMVALHELIIELFAANGALMVLLFPYGKLYLVGKSTEVEVMLIHILIIRKKDRPNKLSPPLIVLSDYPKNPTTDPTNPITTNNNNTLIGVMFFLAINHQANNTNNIVKILGKAPSNLDPNVTSVNLPVSAS